MKKILVVILDVDGCIYRDDFPKKFDGDPAKLKEWILTNNKPLFRHISKIIREGEYKKVIICSFSNRQSKALDFANAECNENTTATSVFPIVQDHLKKGHPEVEVVFDSFMLADIFAWEIKPGESYRRILKTWYQDSEEKHADSVFDESKILLAYALMHRAATIHSKDSLTVHLYDDRMDILDGINKFFNQHLHWMPSRLTLNLCRYDGEIETEVQKPPVGTGISDSKYIWSVRFLAAREDDRPIFTGITGVNSSCDLEIYHRDSPYQCRKTMNIYQNLTPEECKRFENFCRDQLPYLSSNPEWVDLTGYCTAEELVEHGLILEKSTLLPGQASVSAVDDSPKATETTPLLSEDKDLQANNDKEPPRRCCCIM